ncbi:MAG: cytochrome c3 family protein, partial [Planctomycetota bacterium]
MPRTKLLSGHARFAGAWPQGLLLLLALGAGSLVLGREVMPNSSRECAICHIRWVRAFERNGTQGDRMEDVLERQAGSGDMCLSCHDGSVVDSRFKVWSTRHHTTDSVPSAAVRIPTETFPLDSKGRMTCATCHTAHAVPDSSDLKTVIFLRKPNVDSSICLACHPEHAQKNDFQHPLGEADFAIPQEILAAGGKTSADGRTVICQTCHEPHGARNAWMLVLPPSKLCIACHTDKSPETAPPAGAPVHRIGHAYPGFEPPVDLLDERATFGSDGELSCLSCHRLHEASGAKPLLIRKNEDSSLCLDCHKKERAILESRHDLRFSSPETRNAGGQTASQSGPCGACHRIHGWARDVPETNRPHSSGCMECHQSGGPGNVNRPYFDAHTVGNPVPENMPEQLPLDEATGSIGCLTCHDPHSPRSSEAEAVDQGESRIHEPRSFLRQDGSHLCVLCHDKLTDLPGQPHDPNAFAPEVRDMLAVHPSVGPCRVCHTTHNAQGPHLWAHKPATTAGQIADLCGSCHEGRMGAQGSVHDPGAGEWAQELGFVSKGSCIDCHPVHDPNEEGGIWGAIPGQAVLPQSCETCHREGAPGKAMETAHMGKTLGIELDNLPDNMELGSDRKIVCTTCHDIHQKEQTSKLLVAPIPDLCGICHEGKLGIQYSVHDTGIADWAKELGLVSGGFC